MANLLLLKLGFLLSPLLPSTHFARGDGNPASLFSTEAIIVTYEWERYYPQCSAESLTIIYVKEFQ